MRAIRAFFDFRVGAKRSSAHDSAKKMIESIALNITAIHLLYDLVNEDQSDWNSDPTVSVFSL